MSATAEKTLTHANVAAVKQAVPDVKVVGDGDLWRLLSKASSQAEGWMKSTKALEVPFVGCIVQVSTQQRNIDGTYSLAEAITWVPGATIVDDENDGRRLESL